MKNISLHTVVLYALVAAFLCVVWLRVGQVREEDTIRAKGIALDRAKSLSITLSAVRTTYTKEVVNNAGRNGMNIVHDYSSPHYDSIGGAIPLPATYSILLAKTLTNDSVQVDLYSNYPFPARAGRVLNDFQKRALQVFEDTKQPQYFVFDDDEKMLYFATPDRMNSSSCVNCHNSHKDSPKRDWLIGDVRGAISVRIPYSGALHKAEEDTAARFMVLVFVLVFAISATLFLKERFTKKDLKKVNDAMKALAQGRKPEGDIKFSQGNLQTLGASVKDLAVYFQEITAFAEKTGKGDFDYKMPAHSAEDQLSLSLQNMQEKLRDNKTLEDKQHWLNTGLAEFGHILTDMDSQAEFSEILLAELVKYISSQCGSLMLRINETDPFLTMISAYALDMDEDEDLARGKQFPLDEGLVGQAFTENKIIYLEDIPPGYIKISSVLGEHRPGALLLVPLTFHNFKVGVVELACFGKYSKQEIEFVEKLGESVAATWLRIKSNQLTETLLEESRMYGEALQKQEQELRNTVGELQEVLETLNKRDSELQERHKEINAQNSKLEEAHHQITSSIKASLAIQQAILPNEEDMEMFFEQYFVLYKPKDIVSGDFYWVEEIGDKLFVIAVDCTGHGVAGALMSMVGHALLDKIILAKHFTSPAKILDELHREVQTALQQHETGNNSGMDIAIAVIDKQDKGSMITFCGAKNPLYYVDIRTKETHILEAARKSIGGVFETAVPVYFKDQQVFLPQGTTIYLGTDGLQDQNNPQRKRFGSQKIKEWLSANGHLPMKIQKSTLAYELNKYMDGVPQRDDILWMGIRL